MGITQDIGMVQETNMRYGLKSQAHKKRAVKVTYTSN